MKIKNQLLLIIIGLLGFIGCEKEVWVEGCTDSAACNYNIYANNDDDSCKYSEEYGDCDEITVTVFLYENCPIAQYMCGPLRDTYRYFCDTLNQVILFRGFSPNTLSTETTIENFIYKYDIPFNVSIDYNHINNQHGSYTQYYQPIVTPEVFVEWNDNLLYRGMIDNSYQSLGEWALPTEHYLFDVLMAITNEKELEYFETTAIGCFINY